MDRGLTGGTAVDPNRAGRYAHPSSCQVPAAILPVAGPIPLSSNTASPHGSGALVLQASIASFLVSVCQWGFVPLFPDMASDLNFGPDQFSVLAALPSILNALLVIPMGRLTDRFPATLILMFGAASLAIGVTLRAVVEGAALFALAQVVAGFGWPAFMAALVTVVLRQVPPQGRTQALGWVLFWGGVGQALGYVIIGISGQHFGWRATSYAAALVAVLALPVLRGMRTAVGTGVAAQSGGGMLAAIGFLRRPRVAALFAVPMLMMVINNGAIYLLPFALRDAGRDSAETGVLMVPLIIGMLFTSALVGRLTERFGSDRVAKGILGLDSAGLFLFAILGTLVPVVVLAYFLMGAVAGTIITIGQARFVAIAERTGAVGPGVAVGCARLAQAIGTAIGPAVAGVVYVQFSLAAAFALFGVLAAVCVVVAGFCYADRVPRSGQGM